VTGWSVHAVRALVLLQIACALIVFDPAGIDTFVLPKSAVSYVIGAAMATVLLLGIYLRQIDVSWSPLHLWVTAMVLCFVAATPFAVDANVAVFGFDRRSVGLLHIAESFVLFVAISFTFRSKRDFGLLLGTAVAAATVVSAYGLLQMSGHDFVSYTEGSLRPISTVGQPDTLGAFSAMTVITCVAVLALQWNELRLLPRILLGVTALLAIGVAYGDGARVAILALVGGAAGAFVARSPGAWRLRGVLGLTFAFTAALAVILASPLASRITPSQLVADRSFQSRLEMLQTGLGMVASRPLLGLGPDNFGVVYPLMRQDRSVDLNGIDVLQNSPHSLVGYVMTSTGIAGSFVLIGVLFVAVRSARHLVRDIRGAQLALVPFGAFFFQSFVSVIDPSLDWIWWAALGVIASGASSVVYVGRRLPPAVRSAAVVGTLVSAVAIAVAWGDSANRIAASEASGRAEHLLGLRQSLAAVQDAVVSTRLDSTRGAPWGRLGTALAAVGNAGAAESAYLEAVRREPWQPAWWRGIALERLALGNTEGATGGLTAALRVDPHDTTSMDLLARIMFNSGNFEAAVRYGDRALELYPGQVSYYDAPVISHERRGEWDVAEAELRRALGFATGSELPHVHALLGQLLEATGRRSDALAELDWLSANAPNDPETATLRLRLATQ